MNLHRNRKLVRSMHGAADNTSDFTHGHIFGVKYQRHIFVQWVFVCEVTAGLTGIFFFLLQIIFFLRTSWSLCSLFLLISVVCAKEEHSETPSTYLLVSCCSQRRSYSLLSCVDLWEEQSDSVSTVSAAGAEWLPFTDFILSSEGQVNFAFSLESN